MGKKSGAKKGEMGCVDLSDSVNSDVGGGGGFDFSRKKKRKHENEFASADEHVEVSAVGPSQRKRTKKGKLEGDSDHVEVIEKFRNKKDKKGKCELPTTGEDSDKGVIGKCFDDKYSSEDVDDTRNNNEGGTSIIEKKSKCYSGDEECIVPVGGLKEQVAEAMKTTSRLDSGSGDIAREEDKKNDKKEKNKCKKNKLPLSKESANVEIFPATGGPCKGNVPLVQGKRFSQEEDALIKNAVYKFIEDYGLGENGVGMVLNCKKYAETRHCWKTIAAALPWRPLKSVYTRAHVLFERGESRSWTNEELDIVRKFGEESRTGWKALADALGKHHRHVRDAWRRIRLTEVKKGRWAQVEYQGLFDLVNMDLQMRALEEKVSKHALHRDNICWESISEKLCSRTFAHCCHKWYTQMTSPMVREGKWADADDYRLLGALVILDACSMEDVDWDCLVDGRTGEVCRKRWAQMIRHIGEHGNESFVEQVDILSKRYCPYLLESRESWDRKTQGLT